jgi:hypothetical protein
MMKYRLTITNIIFIAVVTIAAIIAMVTVFTPAQAAWDDNVFGQAWGASGPSANAPASSVGGIGWVSMNNCDSVNGPCDPVDFGVNVDQNGVFSGQAWSSNYGWINFDGASHCPAGAPQVDLDDVAVNGSAYITGFAHVTSVGTGDNYWDGCIGMSGTTTPNGLPFGVTLDNAGNITGAAWGANVVGWVSFDAVYMIALGCTDPSASNYDPTAVIDDGSCNIPNDMCPNISGMQATNSDVDAILGAGWIFDNFGNCIVKGDMCPNLAGNQKTVPPGMIINPNNGYCVIQLLIPMCPTDSAYDTSVNSPDYTLCTTNPPPGSPTIPIFEEI